MATKKKIKTYGVRGLMEWVCNIPVGKSHLRIEFTGGVLTSYGNTPAKYVTKDLLQQTIIEHSDFFKKKRIVLLSVIETNEDEDRISAATKQAEAPKAETTEAPEPTGEKSGDDKTDGTDDDEGDGDTASRDDNPKADAGSDGERTADGKLIVKVSSLDDAKTYLNEKCGIAVRELRSKAKILEAAENNGISFEGI